MSGSFATELLNFPGDYCWQTGGAVLFSHLKGPSREVQLLHPIPLLQCPAAIVQRCTMTDQFPHSPLHLGEIPLVGPVPSGEEEVCEEGGRQTPGVKAHIGELGT